MGTIWKFRQRKKKKGPRRLLIAGIILALYTIGGFFVAPKIVKSQLEKRASALLAREVTVQKVRVNPYALSVTLEGFDIREANGQAPFLGWDRLYVNFDALKSLLGAWTFSDIELDGFHVGAELRKDGSFNFTDIVNRFAATPPGAQAPATPAALPPIRVISLKVNNARATFADASRTRPFRTTLGPTTFSATEFRTAKDRGAPYHFEAVTESGEKLAWSGTLSAVPVASTGELQLENIALAKYAPYYADLVQADVTEGKLSLQGRYEMKFDGDDRVMKLLGGAAQLHGLKLVERANQAVAFELPSLEVTGVSADALALKAVIASVTLTGGRVHARREKDGSINLLTMLQPPAAEAVAAATPTPGPAPTAQPSPAKLPDFKLGEVALKNFQVEIADLAAPRPAQLTLGNIQASLKDVTLADGAVMPLSLALDWAPQGTVKVEGTVALKPEIKADLKTNVTALALLPLSPYLEQFANARIAQGAVSLNGAVQAALPAGSAPAITFDGGVTVDQFGLVDGVRNEELAGFASLALNGLKATTSPQLAVSLAELNVTSPYARVVVAADKSLNLATLAKTEPEAGGGASRSDGVVATTGESGRKAPPTTAQAPLPKIEIAKVTITGGDFSLADHSLEPNVRMAVGQFGGTIIGMTSANLGRGDVDLKALVDGVGPVSITGKLDPLGARKFVDLKIDFKNVDLVPLSPYSGKYAGYELARGKLNVDVQAKLDDRQLDVANVITLNQFTFGSPVESKEATKLPVRLGVALLKDINGQIVIDVPMSGSIDDPNLRIGKVVLRVIVNLLTKAAVSPFALLGSMFGGGGDELAWQEFAPGGSELQATELKKLETMVKALTNRPGLSVALEGGYDGPADTFALRQQKFAALVRGRIWAAKHATDPNIAPPDKLEITPEMGAAMIKQLFDEKFPPGTQFGAPLSVAPATTAAPAGAKRSFLRRILDLITFRSSPEPIARPTGAAKTETVAANATGAAPTGPTVEEMSGRMAETMEVTDDDLRALAAARAQRVRDYFINEGKISADRLFLIQGKEQRENKGPRVFLTLQ